MEKFTNAANAYLEKRSYSYPVGFELLNKEAVSIIGLASFIEMISGLFLGWILNLIFFKWIGVTQYLTISTKQIILFSCLYFVLAFVIGGIRIYGKQFPSMMTKEQTVLFLNRVFEFTDFFTKGIFIITFSSNFFGV